MNNDQLPQPTDDQADGQTQPVILGSVYGPNSEGKWEEDIVLRDDCSIATISEGFCPRCKGILGNPENERVSSIFCRSCYIYWHLVRIPQKFAKYVPGP